MKSLTKEKRYDLIDAFNSTSRYLDDLLNIDNIHFEHIVHRIYPAELQLNKANASDTEAAFLDLNLSIHNDIVSTKISAGPKGGPEGHKNIYIYIFHVLLKENVGGGGGTDRAVTPACK